MRITKVFVVFVALFLAVFMASSAMAFQVTNRSAEMDDFSPCDLAGTIKMTFQSPDLDQIKAYLLAGNAYAMIRITLNGTDLPTNPKLPTLCKDIHGTAVAAGVPHSGSLVQLTDVDYEISQFTVPGTPDATIYVYGNAGDRFITVYITNVDNVTVNPANPDNSSWFRIGRLASQAPNPDHTAICAQVEAFSGVSKLTISNEAVPNTLTFSGDNEIGHFLEQKVELGPCVKGQRGGQSDTTSIALCPLGTDPQNPSCPNYFKCFVAEGDWQPDETVRLTLRLNGATDGADTQNGVFFRSILLFDEAGTAIPATWNYYKSNGTTKATMPCAAWEAEIAVADISSNAVLAGGNAVVFHVSYTVNPDLAMAGTAVRIWATGASLPCGTLFDGVVTAANLVACGSGFAQTLLFPYFTAATTGAWWNGIVVVNLGTTTGSFTVKVYEKDGDIFQSQAITLVPSADRIFVKTLDDPSFTWTKVSGSGSFGDSDSYIYVTTDFPADGFGMMGNNAVGNDDSMGYLPRLVGVN